MNMIKDWQLSPCISFHVYCDRKNQFLLKEDVYSEWAVFAVEEGSFRYTLRGVTDIASEGDIVFVPPGENFRRETITPLSFHFIRLQWKNFRGDIINGQGITPSGKVRVLNTKRLYSTYNLLRPLSRFTDPFNLHCQSTLFNDIWCLYWKEKASQGSSSSASTDDPLVNRALQFIEEHACEKLSMKALAALLGLSPVQFTRKFQAAVNITPMEYLTIFRLQKAQKLLTDTELTLAQIAARCGYENEYYLSRVFKKKMNMNPSTYRTLNKL